MKKYLYNSIAVILAVGINLVGTAKVNEQGAVVYLIYASGAQTVVGNYSSQLTQPATCNLTGWLCWIKVNDTNNNGSISQAELNAFFATYDTDSDGSLDDETEITNRLEKKFFGERKE